MPRRHCKTCWVCVTLGEIPRWHCAQRGWMLALRLRPSRPPVFFLPWIFEEKTAGRGFERPVTRELMLAQCPHASPSPQREREFTRPLHSAWSASLRCERHDLIRCEWRWIRWIAFFFLAASDTKVLSGSVTDPALLTSSSLCNTRLRADEELIRVMTKAVNELEWYPLRSHLAAGCTSVFSRDSIKPPANAHPPSSPEVHDELTILWHPPPLHPSFCFRCSHISWRHWRERIRASAPSGWVRGRASLPVHGYRMEGKGEPSIQAVHQHLLDASTRRLDKKTQPMSFVPGHSYRLSAEDSNCLSAAGQDDSAPRGFLWGRYHLSAQRFPENAGPYGSGFTGTSVGSASHATHPVLAEADGSIRDLASWTPQRNCD